MTQLVILDNHGKSREKILVDDKIFAINPNKMVIARAVRVYLTNQRQATAKTKTRGEVSGSGRKIWRQKGTGRARHGDRYAPIFVGGGIAHGPRGNQNVKRTLSKKLKKLALSSVLSEKLKEKKVYIVDSLEKLEPKTKILNNSIKQIIGDNKILQNNNALVIAKGEEIIQRAARNLNYLNLFFAENLCAYDVLSVENVIFTKKALLTLQGRYKMENEDKDLIPKKLKAKVKKPTIKKNQNSKSKKNKNK
jgi:large subunit ribosomal protein L4